MNPITLYLVVLLVFHRVTHPPVISHKCYHVYSLIQNAQTCKYLSQMLGYPNTSFCSVALLIFFHLNYMYSPIIKWGVYNSRPFLQLFLCLLMYILINIKNISLLSLLLFVRTHTSTYLYMYMYV